MSSSIYNVQINFNLIILTDINEENIQIKAFLTFKNKSRRLISFDKDYIIKLYSMKNKSYLAINYDKLIEDIVRSKNEVKEKCED